jgi:hypothetical protein
MGKKRNKETKMASSLKLVLIGVLSSILDLPNIFSCSSLKLHFIIIESYKIL